MNDQTYDPLCGPCHDDGDETRAVHAVHAPFETTHLCARHFAAWEAEQYRQSGEPDYGPSAAEQMRGGYDAMEARRR